MAKLTILTERMLRAFHLGQLSKAVSKGVSEALKADERALAFVAGLEVEAAEARRHSNGHDKSAGAGSADHYKKPVAANNSKR